MSQISNLTVRDSIWHFCVRNAAPIYKVSRDSDGCKVVLTVGSFPSVNSLLTKRRHKEDLPEAASPRRTSLTLAARDIVVVVRWQYDRGDACFAVTFVLR